MTEMEEATNLGSISEEENVEQPCHSKTVDHAKDLPLMSNITDIHITHYILQLKCQIESKTLEGSILLFKCSDVVSCWKCTKKPKTIKQSKLFPWKYTYSPGKFDSGQTEHDYSTQTLCEYRRNFSEVENKPVQILSATQVSSHQSIQKNVEKEMTSVSTCIKSSNAQTESKSRQSGSSECFKLVLDCCDIEVDIIEEVDLPLTSVNTVRNQYDRGSFNKLVTSVKCVCQLQWEYGNHSISIWKEGVCDEKQFPDMIRIQYKTTPKGQSLKWTVDQSKRCCMFTHGHWINNRSFFPSQDAPVAMATWEAEIEVPTDMSVVMGGDAIETTTHLDTESGRRKEYFYSSMDMPSSTLSIGIGQWKCEEIGLRRKIKVHQTQGFIHRTVDVKLKSCRIIGPETIVNMAHSYIQKYIPVCLSEANKILGPYPFKRLDILIVPPCFDSLGMASPSVMYISQSLLTGDCSMFVRLAHELCHSWFGLIIGPKDWTEEWLTEGFCSYLEDVIHINVKMALGKSSLQEAIEETEIRKYLKYKTLENELQTTDSDLQMLRPNKNSSDNQNTVSHYVKDGMNPDKRFLQVHYLKGYFLLCYLESFVDRNRFVAMLHSYVITFYKELVSSQDAVSFMFNVIPEYRDRGLTVEGIIQDWLDAPGMPEVLKNFDISRENTQYINVEKQVSKMRMAYPIEGCRKRKKTPSTQPTKLVLDDLSPIQLVLFLEMLLEDDKIPESLLSQVHSRYSMTSENADIQHRWCELVVKHKAMSFYNDLMVFLLNHQAMGVYLYGEMVLSGCKKQKSIAEQCFRALKDDMEPDPYSTVKAMLYG